MKLDERIKRAALGLIVLALVLGVGLSLVQEWIPTWGATPQEVAQTLPGDALIPNPLINWTHAITIAAPSSEVWGWIAQIGERRGAFYSYTFIENRMGNGNVYQNADRIVPQWQNPQSGDVMIKDGMAVKQVIPGKYLLGASDGGMGWTWLWYLEQIDATHTRLIVRNHIAPPTGMTDGGAGVMFNLGGFVMEQGMLQGLKARAEGNIPLAFSETLDIIVWLAALAAGIVGAVFFVLIRNWVTPLEIGVSALLAILLFTFWQPPIGGRIIIDLVLWGAIAFFIASEFFKTPRAISPDRSKPLILKPLS